MKVKKLEWWVEGNHHWYANNSMYIVTKDSKVYIAEYLRSNSTVVSLNDHKTPEQAKEACQNHFEKFILSQIEPDVKPFDPTLLGLKLIDTEFIGFKEHPLSCFIHPNKTELIYFPSDKWNIRKINKYGFMNDYLLDIKIPDHEFGVKLISQFLGVE